MKSIKRIKLNAVRSLLGVAVLACAGAASAAEYTINFQEMADGAWGESAWQPLPLDIDGNASTDVEIRGKYNGSDVYAYLDASTAGLGTCRALESGANSNTKNANSGSNICEDSGDDNVNIHNGINEELEFSFLADFDITGIWFNNNHDNPKSLENDSITIGTVDHMFTGTAVNADLGWYYAFGGTDGNTGAFGIGDSLNIQYFNEQFYISAVVFDDTPPTDRDTPVPIPSTLVLLGLGLAGLGARKRRK